MKRRTSLAAIFLLLAAAADVRADVTLPSVFDDNMVLQRDREAPVWGSASPGEAVTVRIGVWSAATIAGSDGTWMVRLAPMPWGGPFTLTVEGRTTRTFQNVMIGDVWVCSGQSNMAFAVRSANNPEYEISRASYPDIRLFQVKRTIAMEPSRDVGVDIPWSECSPTVIPSFSAVGYFFSRELYQTYRIPIGLIHTSWGGTPAEAWTSPASLRDYPEFQPILDRFAESLPGYEQKYADWEQQLAAWQATAQKLRAEGKDPGRAPAMPYGPKNAHAPSGLYNGMIAGLVPFAVTGAIWYQGESNAGRAYQYRRLFSTMIRSWRDAWGQGDFPFLFVQLANYLPRQSEPVMEDWAELREAQVQALQLPNVGMAVAIDIGEADDIHPRNKQDVGRRLAAAARRIAYGEDVVHSGPVYHSMTVQNSTVRLRFTSTGSGLAALDGPLTGFAVAGIDRVFHWADAVIDGDVVVLSCPQVPHPVAARYAWANNPACNLYNREGLPASPFRTDDWRGITADKLR